MKTGTYTAKIEARKAELRALREAGVPEPNYDYLFAAEREDEIEQEILASFGGYDAMVRSVETELAGKRGMTADEMIAHLKSLI